jgi:hypothetical protein
LNQEITLAELEELETRVDELDVRAALSFAEYILLNAPKLWSGITSRKNSECNSSFSLKACNLEAALIEPM